MHHCAHAAHRTGRQSHWQTSSCHELEIEKRCRLLTCATESHWQAFADLELLRTFNHDVQFEVHHSGLL